jgi:hypothetical protein
VNDTAFSARDFFPPATSTVTTRSSTPLDHDTMLRALDQYAARAGRLVSENPLAVASVVSGATVALYPKLMISPVLRPLGFTPDGIVAGMYPLYPANPHLFSRRLTGGVANYTGSLAAAAQSALGDVGPGGIFAFCQSAAAGGYGATSVSATASATAATLAKVIAAMHGLAPHDDEYARSDYGAEDMSSERAESPTRSSPPQTRTEVRGQWGPGGHSPVYVEETRTCWLCRLKWGPECEELPETNWACERCETPLCLNEERNCYREFHAH